MNPPPPLVNAVYYPSWRVFKEIPPSSLPVDRISTIFYAFAIPNEDGTFKFLDEYADAQIAVDGAQGCLGALAKLKQEHPHLRTVLSIGGGTGSGAFSKLASSASGRAAFAQSALDWVNRYSFDGIDIDWEHPKTPTQGDHFIQLLEACRAVLPAPRYLLATALPVDPSVLDVINMRKLAALVDHVNLMCYDFAGSWSPAAGHHAQLHSDRHNPSCQSGLKTLLSRGVPSNKILLGIPAYARCFPGANRPGDRFRGEGELEMDYRDVPHEWKAGATVDRNLGAAWYVDGQHGGKGLVSFDVPETVRMKAAFARSSGLGGIFFWTGAGDGVGPDSLVNAGFEGMNW